MLKELRGKYKNVTVESIMMCFNFCEAAQKKRNFPTAGLLFEPMYFKIKIKSRPQKYSTDVQPCADWKIKLIHVCPDHGIKYM